LALAIFLANVTTRNEQEVLSKSSFELMMSEHCEGRRVL
jgi:hypothetical protein